MPLKKFSLLFWPTFQAKKVLPFQEKITLYPCDSHTKDLLSRLDIDPNYDAAYHISENSYVVSAFQVPPTLLAWACVDGAIYKTLQARKNSCLMPAFARALLFLGTVCHWCSKVI